MVVFNNNNLCKIGIMLHSKKSLIANLWHFCGGLIWSVLRIKACARWAIMTYIVKLPHCKRMPTFSGTFCSDYLVVFKNISLCRMGIISI